MCRLKVCGTCMDTDCSGNIIFERLCGFFVARTQFLCNTQNSQSQTTAQVPVCFAEPIFLADRTPTCLDGITQLWMNAVNGNRTGWTVLCGDVQVCLSKSWISGTWDGLHWHGLYTVLFLLLPEKYAVLKWISLLQVKRTKCIGLWYALHCVIMVQSDTWENVCQWCVRIGCYGRRWAEGKKGNRRLAHWGASWCVHLMSGGWVGHVALWGRSEYRWANLALWTSRGRWEDHMKIDSSPIATLLAVIQIKSQ